MAAALGLDTLSVVPIDIRPSDDDTPLAQLGHLLWCQDGVVSRQQVLDCGIELHDLQRMLRRQELVRVHPGVFVHHNGPLTWAQRVQAAVLHAAPAALHLESALPKPDESGAMHVAVDVSRTVRSGSGIVVHRLSGFADLVDPSSSPPRIAVEHVVLLVADRAATDLDALHVLSGVIQKGQTTAAKVRRAMSGRRYRRGVWLRAILDDLAAGTHSVLEHGYLTRVEQPHGLPAGERQVVARSSGRVVIRDVEYAALRLTYGQVFGTPCRTADCLAVLMRRRGREGTLTTCPDCPE